MTLNVRTLVVGGPPQRAWRNPVLGGQGNPRFSGSVAPAGHLRDFRSELPAVSQGSGVGSTVRAVMTFLPIIANSLAISAVTGRGVG